jgi:hypothetical protein
MTAFTSNLINDMSTLANFKAWAQAVSTAVSGFGWTQSTDTGQVDWSTIVSVPTGGSTYVYEIWQPADSLANFYLKIEYGQHSTGSPGFRLTISDSTDGAGNPTGIVVGPIETSVSGYGATGAVAPCYFSGDTGRFHVMMWRAGGNGNTQCFSVERSLNSSGTYTSDHVTLALTANGIGGDGETSLYFQQTLLFGVGAAPVQSATLSGGRTGGMPLSMPQYDEGTSVNFNGTVAFDTIKPYIGFYDYPLTGFGGGPPANYVEGEIFTTNLYGNPRTYVGSQANSLGNIGPRSAGSQFCMRYD